MSSGTVSINKAAPVILSIPSASGITYGQTLADSALTGGAANIPGTFEWTNPSVVPAVSDSKQQNTVSPLHPKTVKITVPHQLPLRFQWIKRI